ncbi:MAG: YceI family protein [Rhizobiaceae bacterium]|nr:YceI family protein [Rhizobiaceae bacterium]
MKLLGKIALGVSLIAATPAFAEWKSVDDQSRVAFGSIKKDVVGEVHHFNGVSGTVSEAGALKIEIDLSSVETYIDIRNERMAKHVFDAGKATAVISGEIDMEEVNSLKPGEMTIVEVETQLAFAGSENDVDAEMLVARLSDNRVLVTTSDFIMLSTEDLGIDAGIDELMKLAKLPGITRVTPVSIRMVFDK